MKLAEVILRDVRGSQPLATAVPEGTLYYVTDENVTERSTGSAWEGFSDAGSGSATLADGDYGDISISGTGTALTIDTGAVSNAKLEDMIALSVKVRASNSSGVPSDLALTDGHTAKRIGNSVVSGRYGWASTTTILTGTTSYTVPASVYRIRIRGVGPGGGGGGGDQGAATSGAGAGGGSGGYFEGWRSVTPGDTFTVAVGAKGTGGTAGNNAGNPGTANTVFDSGGTPWTGNLGSGGASMATGTTLAAAVGGASGTATGATFNLNGQTGDQSLRTANNVFRTGKGGDSPLGHPGPYATSGAGAAAVGYGAGGAGGSCFSGSADTAGGDGADGVIIVEEYN